jgi:hypothetical protein
MCGVQQTADRRTPLLARRDDGRGFPWPLILYPLRVSSVNPSRQYLAQGEQPIRLPSSGKSLNYPLSLAQLIWALWGGDIIGVGLWGGVRWGLRLCPWIGRSCGGVSPLLWSWPLAGVARPAAAGLWGSWRPRCCVFFCVCLYWKQVLSPCLSKDDFVSEIWGAMIMIGKLMEVSVLRFRVRVFMDQTIRE